jgi:hypothetical protein
MNMNIDELEKGLDLIRKFCEENGIKDVLYNQKYLEIMAAKRHGMVYNPDPQGADATNPATGGDVEIKCCREGGSWQFHWLSNNKMNKLKKTEQMILAVHNNYQILRSYQLNPSQCNDIKLLIEQKATGTSSIGGHKSFSEKQLKNLGLI